MDAQPEIVMKQQELEMADQDEEDDENQDQEASHDGTLFLIANENNLDLEIPFVDLEDILRDFNWHAGGDATELETSLIKELQALEAVFAFNIGKYS